MPLIYLSVMCFLTVYYYYVTYEFQSKSTSCCCLNVKELLVRNRRHIWRLSDSNGIRIHNDLVHERTFNHLAKLANLAKWLLVNLRTKCLWVRIPLMCFLVETPEYFNAALFYYCKENFVAAISNFFWKYY